MYSTKEFFVATIRVRVLMWVQPKSSRPPLIDVPVALLSNLNTKAKKREGKGCCTTKRGQ